MFLISKVLKTITMTPAHLTSFCLFLLLLPTPGKGRKEVFNNVLYYFQSLEVTMGVASVRERYAPGHEQGGGEASARPGEHLPTLYSRQPKTSCQLTHCCPVQ